MVVYEIRPNGSGKCELYFVASRLIEYDMKVPDHSGEDSKGKSWNPLAIKKAVEK
jgi:ABC-type enterochelin transport system ATPase subunit